MLTVIFGGGGDDTIEGRVMVTMTWMVVEGGDIIEW